MYSVPRLTSSIYQHPSTIHLPPPYIPLTLTFGPFFGILVTDSIEFHLKKYVRSLSKLINFVSTSKTQG